MRNIELLNNGAIGWDKYFEYLKNNRNLLPNNIYEYASELKHYSLSNKESLHDSWLEGILVKEFAKDDSRFLEVRIVFLGPYHDRKFEFLYSGVTEYFICNEGRYDGRHGDVYLHEFYIENSGFCHEITFFSKSVIRIHFKDLTFKQLSVD